MGQFFGRACWSAAKADLQLTAGAFEGCQGLGLSLKAFLKWSKQLPALLISLKSLLAAGSIDTGNAPASAANNVSSFKTHHQPGHACLDSVFDLVYILDGFPCYVTTMFLGFAHRSATAAIISHSPTETLQYDEHQT